MFSLEQEQLLEKMRLCEPPDYKWPSGCYGSACPWLTFVGPSPGGTNPVSADELRKTNDQRPLWNEDFNEPCNAWSPGFRITTRILIETILGRSSASGALKLFSFANFDWLQNPKASSVPESRMRSGVQTVSNLLESVKPRVIVSLEKRSHALLFETLSKKYELKMAKFAHVSILCCLVTTGPRLHTSMEAFKVLGDGPLNGTIVMRCPQHPARILNTAYASRVSRAMRHTLISLAEGSAPIHVEEV